MQEEVLWDVDWSEVGIGVATCRRPEYFVRVMAALIECVGPTRATIAVCEDGPPDARYDPSYAALPSRVRVSRVRNNRGVAHVKNRLFGELLDSGARYIFIVEDDLLVHSQLGLMQYITTCRRTGFHHLNFGLSVSQNLGRARSQDGLSFYPECGGALSFYTREALETVGPMDERFFNAWEHVEHTFRLARQGFTHGGPEFVDVEGSERHVSAIPGSLTTSVIRDRPDAHFNIIRGLLYWEKKDPDGFPLRHLLR